jgi:hypothetical protein
LIANRALATGEIVEDLALTAALIEAGVAPMLDTGAVIESELARSATGAATQRARWEWGSIRLAARWAQPLFGKGLKGDWKSLLMALDLLIPPLTVLLAIIAGGMLAGIPFALGGDWGALCAFSDAGLLFAVAVVGAWVVYGRSALPPRALAGLGGYLLGKFRVYSGEGRKSARRWTRTDRGEDQ